MNDYPGGSMAEFPKPESPAVVNGLDYEKAEPSFGALFAGAAHESECLQRNGSSILLVELERAAIAFAALG